MTKLIAFLISVVAVPALADNCRPGITNYQNTIQLVLTDFASRPENLAVNAQSGGLHVSVINDEVVEMRSTHTTSRITIRASYGQVADEFGLKVRKVVYLVTTDPACSKSLITAVDADPDLGVQADPLLSQATRSALEEYLKTTEVPVNTRSGSHSLRIHTPTLCDDGHFASVNIVRSHTVTSRITKRTSAYLIELKSGAVLKTDTRWGGLLSNLCSQIK